MFGACDIADGEERAPTAERTLGPYCWFRCDHAIAAGDQHTERRVQDMRLEIAIEGVGKEHDFRAAGRAMRLGPRRENPIPPARQGPPAAQPGQGLQRARQSRDLIAQIEDGWDLRRVGCVARQERNQAIAQAIATAGQSRGLDFEFHARHVDAGRAFAATGFAGHTQLHRCGHRVRRECVRAELAGECQSKSIGAAARDMLLVTGDAIAGAHGAAIAFAAGAVVVAHLDGALEPAGSARVLGPVQLRRDGCRLIGRSVAQEAAVVEAGRPHDSAGIENACGIKPILDRLESADNASAVHRLVEFGAHQSVAVLAGMRSLVGAHERKRFLGDGAHGLQVYVLFEVQDRSDMQATLGGVRVPGAPRAVPFEDVGQLGGVFSQMLQRYGAVFNERDRLSRVLHGHHDVEAGRANVGNR